MSWSPSQWATIPCVSRTAWVWTARRYVASWTVSASAKPFSMSPRVPPRAPPTVGGGSGPITFPFRGAFGEAGACPSAYTRGAVGRHGLLQIRDEGRRLVLHLHQPRRILRDLLGHRGDRRDVLAREADQLGVRRPDRLHAGEPLGLGRVDPDDLAGGDRRPDHLGPEHAREAARHRCTWPGRSPSAGPPAGGGAPSRSGGGSRDPTASGRPRRGGPPGSPGSRRVRP